MNTIQTNRVDFDKCPPCQCGSNLPAQFVCRFRDSCSGLLMYCEDDSCADQHEHRIFTIASVLQLLNKKVSDFKELVKILKGKLVDKYQKYEPIIKFYSECQKNLIEEGQITKDGRKHLYLDKRIDQIDKLSKDVDAYLESIELLQLEYNLMEIMELMETKGKEYESEYEQVSTLSDLNDKLLQEIYPEAIALDYENEDLMNEFTQDNWNTFHKLKNYSIKKELNQKDKRIADLESKVQMILNKLSEQLGL
ncbi:UNKNOWN [Stylonychia lemnae]|uniref:Uncharacterized protein n=1 Tax=Stylonychia lemnae TaxID=5949 RepID=A0A078BAW1_STYLE|nr:UNKNOWN [Stylonychia lemnae]|eukprot:CDW91519.1 UNKNOWN [Stylonychia lemnae]